MDFVDKLNHDIYFPISDLYNEDFYSTSLPALGNVKFILTFYIRKNQLIIKFERNTSDLTTYSIQISSCQPDPIVTKSQIRYNKGQRENEIILKEASDYILGQFYKINIQIEPKQFTIPKYQEKNSRQNPKRQSKLGDFFAKTTEDYLGLPNQGATCYLNSLLQVLFHLKKFRKMIYSEKVEQNESNFIFCLQLLFRDLQQRKTRRTTRHLTNSLKWDKNEIRTSQDVSEFYKFLIETILKGNLATRLFEGEFGLTITDYQDCSQQFRKEKFFQIMLKVDGFSSLNESLKMFFSPFSFYDNQAKNGTKESIKQMSISKFPPVLSIVLKRYHFNKDINEYEKLNSILVFPNLLDFSEFGFQNCVYQLFAIIAHIGTINSGHYVCFINPDLKGNWYEFDDNKVYKMSEDETFDLCYGKKKMGAYMLFYIKLDFKDEIFTNSLDIPQNIEKYKYIVVKDPPSLFYMNNEDGIIKNLKKLKSSYLNIDVRKSIPIEIGTSFNNIYSNVAALWNKKPNLIRIWNVKNDSLINVFDRKEKLKKNENRCWFVQDISESEEINVFENNFIAFLVFYLPNSQQKLFYLGSHQFCVFDIIFSIQKVLFEKYLLKHFTLFFYAFIKDRIIPITNPSLKFIDLSLVFNGIFFIIQAKPDENISFQDFSINLSNQIEFDFQNECEIVYNDVKGINDDYVDSYINSQFNQLTIYLFNFLNHEKPFVKLIVQKGSSSSHLKNLIAFNVGFEYNENEDTILLFNKSHLSQFLDEESLNYILQKGNSINNLCFLVYKGIKEFNQFNQMKIKICYSKKQIEFFIVKNESKKMIQQNLIDNNIIPDKKNLRFYLVYQSRITSILNDNDTISDENCVLHIEDIPKYQMEDDIFIIKVSQSIKDGDELVCFGDPFIIGVKFDEFCINAKEKICLIIGCDINKINILTQINMGKEDSYRLLLDKENILDALDGNNEIFVLLGS